ncbi:hypothetical protein FHS21_005625 [Phyllobacterium trifolii]|uniref:Uncharacterized protein n=1 Tax=Phyllobacterium trifolii TaxID=300193 RepID=A0A839UHC4_9HYPH|nr:type I restriction endonuclease [Phyllobacterium trifolii]MBB3149173.1 hypothetical protein [Phyllobacterium trifolii]
MRWAIEALMGREVDIWPRAVRKCTAGLIETWTDPPGAAGRPVARDLIFPREATEQAINALTRVDLFTVLVGPPASGKTNLLCELALRTTSSDELAVLMLQDIGPGLFQAVSNLFSRELEWTLTPHDARHWLRRMSKGTAGPTLVIAIDGVRPSSAIASDLQELADLGLGERLKVILTTDQPEGLTRTGNGRGFTRLGSLSQEIELGPLNLNEFKAACSIMENNRIFFVPGASFFEENRVPWVLRTIYDHVAGNPRFKDETWGVTLQPTLGVGLIDYVQDAFAGQSELLRAYRSLARDALADDQGVSGDLALEQSNGFVIRRDALSAESHASLRELRTTGQIRTYRRGRIDVVVPTIPALFVAELAEAASEILGTMVTENPYEGGHWLGTRLEGFFLGEVIGAQAIRILAETTGGFSREIVRALVDMEPREDIFEDRHIALQAANGEVVDLVVRKGKAWRSDRAGNRYGEPVELDELPRMLANTTAWMILAHLSLLPMASVGDIDDRLDAQILFAIGQCAFPLMRASLDPDGHLEHEIEGFGRVLCPKQGAIEIAAVSLARLFSQKWDKADEFIDAIIAEGSLPLMNRTLIALRTVRSYQIPARSDWAASVEKDKLGPAIEALISTVRKRKSS